MMGEFDRVIDRKGTSCIKWDRGGAKFQTDRELLPLWIADTDFRAPPAVMEAIAARTGHGIFGYSFCGRDYAEAVCDWLGRRHGLTVEWEWVSATTGVVTAMYFAVLALTEVGDQVMTLTPIYDPFYAVVKNTGRTLVRCPLLRQEDTYRLDLAAMEEGFRQGVKVLLFCNPHNPTGRVWTREELACVARLCKQYDVRLISDEIHGDFALFGHRYTSFLALEEIHDRLVMCSSAGKSFNLAGLGTAHTIIPNPDIREAVDGALRGAWMDEQRAYLEENSRFVRAYFQQHLPRVQLARHEGTFLMWMDFSCFDLPGGTLCQELAKQCGVGLGSGAVYAKEYGQFVRMNIGCARSILERACQALGERYRTLGL